MGGSVIPIVPRTTRRLCQSVTPMYSSHRSAATMGKTISASSSGPATQYACGYSTMFGLGKDKPTRAARWGQHDLDGRRGLEGLVELIDVRVAPAIGQEGRVGPVPPEVVVRRLEPLSAAVEQARVDHGEREGADDGDE